jgi:hypothetical protein
MIEKELGKIISAEFGVIPDYPWQIGLKLNFKFQGGAIGDGGRYTENISEACKWNSEEQKCKAYEKVLKNIADILKKAKVNHISELVGKPVEVTIEGNLFKDFRILEEVL